ncbi:hypothetical protein NA57DRAFT_54318 [Rhizodiscina lignyota]|uniref:Uncharacterized protein n=1 Tax=Rhizodiscina lignyota TaxID=1504668 RepID=A0A9P4IER1_9PEZI|nr:hypothetical protein NA57DRAFT_54318 [Rhizodiscina lignyota]
MPVPQYGFLLHSYASKRKLIANAEAHVRAWPISDHDNDHRIEQSSTQPLGGNGYVYNESHLGPPVCGDSSTAPCRTTATDIACSAVEEDAFWEALLAEGLGTEYSESAAEFGSFRLDSTGLTPFDNFGFPDPASLTDPSVGGLAGEQSSQRFPQSENHFSEVGPISNLNFQARCSQEPTRLSPTFTHYNASLSLSTEDQFNPSPDSDSVPAPSYIRERLILVNPSLSPTSPPEHNLSAEARATHVPRQELPKLLPGECLRCPQCSRAFVEQFQLL